jgi:hypothetical protein
MLWGSKNLEAFARTINDTIKNENVKAVLGMNEYVHSPPPFLATY